MAETNKADSRLAVLSRWVFEDLGFAGSRIEPASADASFRRYFRLTRGRDTYIVMDAPPDKENLQPFLQVADILIGLGLNVPWVLARDLTHGLLLLSDLGSIQYLDALTARNADRLYSNALAALATMQTAGALGGRRLPRYDQTLLVREMQLMPEWFLNRHLGLKLEPAERDSFDRLFAALTQAALEQPSGFVHRDYHSRNLMVCTDNNPGILDFQDAVQGPLTYDLVSLLKDCYLEWPTPRVRTWALEYRERLLLAGVPAGTDEAQFIQWFDLMGVQRHIKVLGIFARLYYRDGKSQYLKELPRVLRYTQAAAAQYAQTAEFADFLEQRVAPEFERAQARALALP